MASGLNETNPRDGDALNHQQLPLTGICWQFSCNSQLLQVIRMRKSRILQKKVEGFAENATLPQRLSDPLVIY